MSIPIEITIEIKPDAKGQMAKIGYAIKSIMPRP
jgi:hypothetical protein